MVVKVNYPSACNAAETILIHKALLEEGAGTCSQVCICLCVHLSGCKYVCIVVCTMYVYLEPRERQDYQCCNLVSPQPTGNPSNGQNMHVCMHVWYCMCAHMFYVLCMHVIYRIDVLGVAAAVFVLALLDAASGAILNTTLDARPPVRHSIKEDESERQSGFVIPHPPLPWIFLRVGTPLGSCLLWLARSFALSTPPASPCWAVPGRWNSAWWEGTRYPRVSRRNTASDNTFFFFSRMSAPFCAYKR